jgi:hypothetical protein
MRCAARERSTDLTNHGNLSPASSSNKTVSFMMLWIKQKNGSAGVNENHIRIDEEPFRRR